MTDERSTPPADVTAREGTVFDIGYQSYAGPREGRNRARLAVVKDGVRASLGLGRGAWPKVLPWLFIVVLVLIAFIWALVIGAVERLGGPGAAAEIGLASHSDYYGVASIFNTATSNAGSAPTSLACSNFRPSSSVIVMYSVSST